MTNIVIFGSSGFVGKAVCQRLLDIQNKSTIMDKVNINIITPNRHQIDFANPETIKDNQAMIKLMQKADIVINLCGVMANDTALMENIHHNSPVQLALIAKNNGVKYWINLSALGADDTYPVSFLASKGRGDKALLALMDDYFKVVIVRPSLIFGKDGVSTRLFMALSRLPMVILPKGGRFNIQPVHIDEVAEGMVSLALTQSLSGVINFTGKNSTTLIDYLRYLRQKFYHKNSYFAISIPIKIAKVLLSIVNKVIDYPLLSQDNLIMLEQSNVADCHKFSQLLGRQPLGFDEFDI